jgi:hypothetical protein
MVPARSGTRVGGMGRHQILDEGHLRGSSGVGQSGGRVGIHVMSPSCYAGRCSSTSSQGRALKWKEKMLASLLKESAAALGGREAGEGKAYGSPGSLCRSEGIVHEPETLFGNHG